MNAAGRKMWVIAVAILMWNLAGSTGLGRNLGLASGWNLGLASTAHAAPQAGDELRMQPRAGDPLADLTAEELENFERGREAYQKSFTEAEGLGPIFNLASCAACHGSPLGGAGVTTVNLFGLLDSETGSFDPLADLGGPVRQANAVDPDCIEDIPSVANVDTRRVTLGAMGYGLLEAIPEASIVAGEDPSDVDGDGVRGFVNWVESLESPGTPMVGRFGWKGQLPTILSFSADAAHNELGLTSVLRPFDNASNAPAGSGGCDSVADPELPDLVGSGFLADVTSFQRLMAAPPQAPRGGMVGETIFEEIGCAVCHTPSFTTSASPDLEEAIRGKVIRPYSDFLVHSMPAIPDGIPAGLAGPDDIRTPPLWGLRFRRKLMHDGSVLAVDFDSGVQEAILQHGPVGEAASSAAAFAALSQQDKDALVRFLRSLGRQDFDVDDDGDLDLNDFLIVQSCQGQQVLPDEPCGVADLDLDGFISSDEVQVLADHLGMNLQDCNNDGIADIEQIASGSSFDLDGNGVPDECQELLCDEELHRFTLAGGSLDDVGAFSTTVSVSEIGEVREVRLSLRGFTHEWAEQLQITLQKVSGQGDPTGIVSQFCGVDWNFIGNYEFRDDAPGGQTICQTVSGNDIPEGTYIPRGASNSPSFGPAFAGGGADGTWILRIEDIAPDGLVANLDQAFIDIVAVRGGSDCDRDGTPDACEIDTDGDGVVDDCDGCPDDPEKQDPGVCGCGIAESDLDFDGQPDCVDQCPNDPLKTTPGECGCGVQDIDTDNDGVADCVDGCPNDPDKVAPGACGCGFEDIDSDGDDIPDCIDGTDCNNNGIDDDEDIENGTSQDCNRDGLPDECQAAGEVAVIGENSNGETDIPPYLPACIDVAAGGNHVAVVTVDGEVVCWGRNVDGECNVPSDLPEVVDVACGAGHTLALDVDGTVHAWGRDNHGQSQVPADLGPCLAIVGGRFHSVALTVAGDIRCWGRDEYGESSPPSLSEPAIAIGAGDYHSLAVLASGEVVGWGRNGDGQVDVPSGLTGCVSVSGGSFHSVALRGDGSVVAWGRDVEGQSTVPAGLVARAIDAGTVCTLAVDIDGSLVSWGDLSSGKGDAPSNLDGLVQVETGGTHAVVLEQVLVGSDSDGDGVSDCADGCPNDPDKIDPGVCGCGVEDIDSDGDGIPDCIDGNDCNENGIDDAADIADGTSLDCDFNGVPDECQFAGEVAVIGQDSDGETSVPSFLPECIDVAAGGNHVTVVTVDGEVVCWGRNVDGECNVPSDLPEVVDVACGAGHTLALDVDGTVHAWGRDNHGQSQVPADLGPCLAIVGGRFHSVALTVAGDIRCWGRDEYGESSPPSLSEPAIAIGAGDYHSLAVLASGEVVGWGRNGDGQVDVPSGLTGCVSVSGGSFHSVALRGDGSVVAWGRDVEGQSTVPAGLVARAIDAGTVCTLAVDIDGSLVSWGDLSSGKGDAPSNLDGLVQVETGGTHAVVLEQVLVGSDSDDDGIPDCIDPCPTWPGECSDDGMTIFASPGETLSLAISKVPDGGTLKLRPGVFNQAIDFAGRSITIEGDSTEPSLVVLDGTGILDSSVVVMMNDEGPDSILRGVTIRNGTAGTLFGVNLVGGAIHTLESSPLVEDCVFDSNRADFGGAVYARKGAPRFVRCEFMDNEALQDGGAFQFSRTEGGRLESCVFESNVSGANGGAVNLFDGDPTIIDSSFSMNVAGGNGGGINWSSFGGFASLSGSTLTGNEATSGGGVFVSTTNGGLSISGSVICDNIPDQIVGQFTDDGGNDPCYCEGDFDGDGVVGGADLGIWLVYAGEECDPGEDCPWDLNGDGFVGGADLGLLLGLWGTCP